MIGGDFNTPIVYQDLANSTMGPMNLAFGTAINPYANTSYLGGVQMNRALDQDKVHISNQKEKQDKSVAKKCLIAIGVILALGGIGPLCKSIKNAGGLGKFVKNKWTSFKNFITGKNTPKAPSQSWWQKFKNKFKKNP